MGKFSRDKGSRAERSLRDHLRFLGWAADRVPLSGASEGFKGDIRARKEERTVIFELKARREEFKTIYALYAEHCRTAQDDVLAIAVPGADNLCLSLSSSLMAAMGPVDYHVLMHQHALYAKYKRTFGKIANLEKLLGEADVLVLRDDRKPFLFIHYK